MAISRMQQPRQMYGLGSFVKKLTRKVTKPFTKVARKLVPKEIAGIMRVAAPFLPPQFRAAAYLLGTAKQTGRISPIDLALVAAPRIGQMKLGGEQTIAQRLGNLKVPFTGEKTLSEVLVGAEAKPSGINLIDPEATAAAGKNVPLIPDTKATSGIFGEGGKMFQFGQEGGPKLLETKAGQTLFGKKTDEGFQFSPLKLGSMGITALSYIKDSKTPEEAGQALASATGDSDDYERGFQLFSQLKPELFAVPEEFRMNVKDGGIMRTNYAMGSGDDDELPEDDTKPINPFQPKPIGPVLPNKSMMASDDMNERLLEQIFEQLLEEGFSPEEAAKKARELFDQMSKASDDKGIMMAGLDRKERAQQLAEMLAEEKFGQDFYDLDIRTQMKVYQIALDEIDSGGNAMGGKPNNRIDLALGTKPTPEESGLGGLPIEADMRYTGGFMPYGAKEKADDVPARLSKNEFVFTADAVRAAGGGSVNEGAKKMYATMKQLEKKPEAKGMMA